MGELSHEQSQRRIVAEAQLHAAQAQLELLEKLELEETTREGGSTSPERRRIPEIRAPRSRSRSPLSESLVVHSHGVRGSEKRKKNQSPSPTTEQITVTVTSREGTNLTNEAVELLKLLKGYRYTHEAGHILLCPSRFDHVE